MNRQKFSFKVIKVGSFVQEMMDKTTILNRPCIFVDKEKIRWGNEYILFNKKYQDNISGKIFLGTFSIDKKDQINLKLFKEIDVPIEPEYYILTIDHIGERLDKRFDLVKSNPESFSKIFSCAYYEDGDKFRCQTMLIVQHSDILIVDGKKQLFSAKAERFI